MVSLSRCGLKQSAASSRLQRRLPCLALPFLVGIAIAASPCRAQSWSPDGKQIAIGGAALLLADAQTLGAPAPALNAAPAASGQPLAPLISSAAPIAFLPGVTGAAFAPTWTRDSRTLAYLAEGQKLTFYDMAKRQARVMDANAVSPAVFSRDSSLFAVVHKTETGILQVLTRYRNGQTFLPPIDLPFHAVPAMFTPLAWLTNTTNLVAAGGDGGKTDLYLLDQGEVVRLTSTGDVLGYVVSPDGTRLRWARATPNTHYILLQFYEMNLDTRSTTKLPYPDVIRAVNPNPHNAPDAVLSVQFAPNMSRFAFTTRGGPQAGEGGTALWISDIAGQSVVFVGKGAFVNGAGGIQAAPVPASALQAAGLTFPAFPPAFSPDSRAFAALRAENNKRFLLIANALTGQGKGTPLP